MSETLNKILQSDTREREREREREKFSEICVLVLVQRLNIITIFPNMIFGNKEQKINVVRQPTTNHLSIVMRVLNTFHFEGTTYMSEFKGS